MPVRRSARVPAALPRPAKALFDLGPRVLRDAMTEPYAVLDARHRALASRAGRAHGALPGTPAQGPQFRNVRIFTQDPATPRMHEPVTELAVPYEPLEPGPIGATITVHDANETTGETYERLDLDDQAIALTSGLKPSTTDPRFAQQMTYALTAATYQRFRQALGRNPQFGFDPHSGDVVGSRTVVKLHIHPHAFEDDNAYYDPDLGALRFGYTRATKHAQGLSQPGTVIFTSLSHDVVVHEMTHALLDGMRARFLLPTNPDVDGFHEGFADLIALFQRFSYRELVARAIADTRGTVTSRLLVDLARQWGAATSDGRTPLRTAFLTPGDLDSDVPADQHYSHDLEAHDMGAVLMRGVFDAFRTVFDQKTASLRSLVSETTAPLPAAMVDLLAGEAVRLAEQFLNILIRAVDYCPPVDLRLGEYLRALITADYDLVPDDPWGYREALVRGFRRHRMTVEGVLDLTEDALLWRGPETWLPQVARLDLADAPVKDDQGTVRRRTPQEAVRIRAEVLGHYVTRPEHLYYFGLAAPSRERHVERPIVESVRQLRRAGPDGTFNLDFVAEIIQRRKSRGRWIYGGSTVILSTEGVIRFIIAKNVNSLRREQQVHKYLAQAPKRYQQYFEDGGASGATRLRFLHRGRTERR